MTLEEWRSRIDSEEYAYLSKAHKAYYKRMIEEGIKLQAQLESQPKSLVEMVRSGELQPPQEINMCPCSDICINIKRSNTER